MVAAGALACVAGTAGAGFQNRTICTGQMPFYNDDGTYEIYSVTLDLGPDGYRIIARNLSTNEETDDSGDCSDYLTGSCRHMVDDSVPEEEVYYDFAVRPNGGSAYLYAEAWQDGFLGLTQLQCEAAAQTRTPPAGRGGATVPPPVPGQQALPPVPRQPNVPPAQRPQNVPPVPGQQGQAQVPRQQGLPPVPGQQGLPPVPGQQALPPVPGQPGLPPPPSRQQLPPPPPPPLPGAGN